MSDDWFHIFRGIKLVRNKVEEKPFRSFAIAMSNYGGTKEFYEAVERGAVDVESEDYKRFYVPRTHACYLLAEVKSQLIARRQDIPRDIELSLARIEGLLAGR